MKKIAAPFEIKKLSDTGEFSGYASIFNNVDLGYDVIEPGAFKEFATTKDGQIRVLYQHDQRAPIGKAKVTQDEKGLAFDGQLILSDSIAQRAYAQMKADIVDGMSVGFDILPGGAEFTESGIRRLKALKLWEISVVTFGMNPEARIDAVKNFTTIREFESFLRDGGYSIAQAKRIAAGGWKALQNSRDEGADASAQIADVIDRLKFPPIKL
jgi:HK97 family phage prohead protease